MRALYVSCFFIEGSADSLPDTFATHRTLAEAEKWVEDRSQLLVGKAIITKIAPEVCEFCGSVVAIKKTERQP